MPTYLLIKFGFALVCAVIISVMGFMSNIPYLHIKLYNLTLWTIIFSPELYVFIRDTIRGTHK